MMSDETYAPHSSHKMGDLAPEEVGQDVVADAAATAAANHASSLQQQQQQSQSSSQQSSQVQLPTYSVATVSSPWQFDDLQPHCTSCQERFHALNRRHHCRLCGKIFCGACSAHKALIPPSSIVLVPSGGKKAKPRDHSLSTSFTPDDDPDRMLTYVAPGSSNSSNGAPQLLYGKGLEERFQLARQPLRVCFGCCQKLQPLQEELRASNSNAMRFNHIDPTHPVRRFLNSPLAFTLGHEIRKAAYTLNNLLPLPKRMGAVIPGSDMNPYRLDGYNVTREFQQCKESCSTVSPNLGHLDGVRIPARLLEQAMGVAVMTVVKGGFGFAGGELGTGLVVARLGDNRWSAPSAIGTAGVSWGALVGAQISDHVFLLMTRQAVELLFHDTGSVQLGADLGVAVGPLGRSLEGSFGATAGAPPASIYTYSMSKGLYAGVSLDGKMMVTRRDLNEKFYGRAVSAQDILRGAIPTPPAAQPLYEALTRCHYYASSSSSNEQRRQQNRNGMHEMGEDVDPVMAEYGEPTLTRMGPPAMMQQQPFQPSHQPISSHHHHMMNAAGAAASPHSYMTPPPGQMVAPPPTSPPPVPTQQHQQHVSGKGVDPLVSTAPTFAVLPPLPEQQQQEQYQQHPLLHENPYVVMPPAQGDQHSYAGMSDITSDPGY